MPEYKVKYNVFLILLKIFTLGLWTDYIEHRKYPGWKGYIAFYKVRCHKHGVQANYHQGHKQKLSCPICLTENIKALRT